MQRSHGNRKLFRVQIAHDRASALKNAELLEDEAQAAIAEAERETGLPASDPVRYGAGALLDALLARSDLHA